MKHFKHLLFLSILCSLVFFTNCGDSEDPVADDPTNNTDDDTDDGSTDPVNYTLTLTASEGGTVTPESGSFGENEAVELLATPDSTHVFVNSTGSSTSTDNPLSVTMDSDKSYTANFVKEQYLLTIIVEGEGTVSEEIISSGRTNTEYTPGSILRLTAVPTSEWTFVGWGGSVTSTENPIELTVDEYKTVIVRFTRSFNYNQSSYHLRHTPLWIDNYSIPKQNNINTQQDGYYKWYDVSETIADFNGDGYNDVLFAPSGDDQVEIRLPIEIYLNQGDNETFLIDDNSLITNNIGLITARKSVIGDFNLDGKPDVFFADHGIHANGSYPGGIPSLLLSNENGYDFQLTNLPRGFYHSATSGDIDNDGDLDIYIPSLRNQNSLGSSAFLINDGIANFVPNNNITDISTISVTSELYDINNDGNLDLISGSDLIRIFYGNGNDFISDSVVEIEGIVGWEVYDFAFSDLDDDGYDDIIVSYSNGNGYNIKIYKQTLNNTFTEKSDYIENSTGGNHSVVWIRVQDIDNNGKIDLIENDKGHFNSEEYSWSNVSGNTPVRWEWDGSRFIKISP